MKAMEGGNYQLDQRELAQAVAIGRRVRIELAQIADATMTRGLEMNMPAQVIGAAICAEALVVAAIFHGGAPESFIEMAEEALIMANKQERDL
jgi:hypothetical protein